MFNLSSRYTIQSEYRYRRYRYEYRPVLSDVQSISFRQSIRIRPTRGNTKQWVSHQFVGIPQYQRWCRNFGISTTMERRNAGVPHIFRCGKECFMCPFLETSDNFCSSVTGERWRIKGPGQGGHKEPFNCCLKGVVYLLTCTECSAHPQFVGATATQMNDCFHDCINQPRENITLDMGDDISNYSHHEHRFSIQVGAAARVSNLVRTTH